MSIVPTTRVTMRALKAVMVPGQTYTAKQLSELTGQHPKQIGAALKHMQDREVVKYSMDKDRIHTWLCVYKRGEGQT